MTTWLIEKNLLTILQKNPESKLNALIQRMGGLGSGPTAPPPSETIKAIDFLYEIGLDPLENHKATKPAFNVGPSLARQRNAI